MPTFFFDHEHYTDDEGEAFPDADAAAREALLALGDVARDHARQNFRVAWPFAFATTKDRSWRSRRHSKFHRSGNRIAVAAQCLNRNSPRTL